MSKKSKFNKPQIRKRQKKTTGKLKFEKIDIVYMDKEKDENDKTRVFASCTCNTWRSSAAATTITKVGLEAKQHIIDRKGACEFRFHKVPDDMLDDKLKDETVEKIAEELDRKREEAARAENVDSDEPTTKG